METYLACDKCDRLYKTDGEEKECMPCVLKGLNTPKTGIVKSFAQANGIPFVELPMCHA